MASGLSLKAQKNVLLIMADDFNHWNHKIGYYHQAITPNIDALAEQGVLFADANCSSPVCNPSRNALMSGLRPSTTGIASNSGGFIRDKPEFKTVNTLNQYFTEQGYYTHAGGKIYHPGAMGEYDTDPNNWSDLYTDGSGASGAGGPSGDDWSWKSDNDGGSPLEWHAGALSNSIGDDLDTKLASHFADKIRTHSASVNGNKPFFFACGFFRPHLPFNCNKSFFDLYNPDTLNLPPGVLLSEDSVIMNDGGVHDEVIQEGVWKYAIRAYLANMSYADYNVGIVMDALNSSDQKDNTIVVFVGDHGWQLGEKRKWKKASVADAANRTTMIIYDPSAAGNGKICRKVVGLQDIYPTLIDLCGLPERNDVEGAVITPLLENPERSDWNNPVLITYNTTHIIKTNKYRFVQSGTPELYDIVNDPYERTNLAANPNFESVIAMLNSKIDSIVAIGKTIKDDNFALKYEARSYDFENNVNDNIEENPGTVSGDPIYVDAFHGKAIEFDGVDDYASIPNFINGSFSIDFWMMTGNTGNSGEQWYQGTPLIDGYKGANTNTFGISLLNRTIAFGSGGDSNCTIQSTHEVVTGKWKHITVTRSDVDGKMILYVDGIKTSSSIGDVEPKLGANVLNIAKQLNGDSYYKGRMDLLTLYNFVLAPSLVKLAQTHPGNLVLNAGFEFAEPEGWRMVRNNSYAPAWFKAEAGVEKSSAFYWGGKAQNNASVGIGVPVQSGKKYRLTFQHQLIASHDLSMDMAPSFWYYFYPSGENFNPLPENTADITKLQQNEVALPYNKNSFPSPWILTDTILTIPAGMDSLFVSINWHKKQIAIDNFAICQIVDSVALNDSIPMVIIGVNNLITEQKYMLYPNPVHNILNLSGVADNQTYVIYNILGKIVMKGEVTWVNVSEFNKGLYFMEIGKELLRFVKN